MKEKVLQEKLTQLVKDEELLEFITGKEQVDAILASDDDEHFLPDFSIDDLLNKRYASSVARVLEALSDYELISGDVIQNISLQKGELLYPDMILFNREKQQIILIENKTATQTGREAITELMAYANEIRNHLPFISNFDIHFVLVAPEFDTLLDHSVAAQLLGNSVNFLCLKIVVDRDQIESFAIHFPSSWTDLGQNLLPAEALISYTMSLHAKEGVEKESFNVRHVVTLAVDIINHEANNFKVGGFALAWLNSFANGDGMADVAITLYILNPFAFIPQAVDNNFKLNEKSPLFNHINNLFRDNYGDVFPSSIFQVATKAKKYLSAYFEVIWERGTNWQVDMEDTQFKLQRFPVFMQSFGAIGDFIRYYYLHPAVRHHMLSDEIKLAGYNEPFVGLQIVDLIAGKPLFLFGEFMPKDIYRMGKYMSMHLQAQYHNLQSKDTSGRFESSYLFWTALPLIQGLKEINMRILDSKDLEATDLPAFPVITDPKGLKPEYPKQILAFFHWVKDVFLDSKEQKIYSELFDLGFKSAFALDTFLGDRLDNNDKKRITGDLISFARYVLGGVAQDLVSGNRPAFDLRKLLDETYFNGKLDKLGENEVDAYLAGQLDELFLETFESEFLDILNEFTGQLTHQLRPMKLPVNANWAWMKQTAEKRFAEGFRRTAIVISANGQLSIAQVPDYLPFTVNDPTEILIQTDTLTSGIATIRKTKWQNILDGSFKLEGNESGNDA